jgi:hypothetical protein
MKREKLSRIKKYPYICYDGPCAGSTLYLATPSTPEFTYNGRRGRYILGTRYFGGKTDKTLLIWENML